MLHTQNMRSTCLENFLGVRKVKNFDKIKLDFPTKKKKIFHFSCKIKRLSRRTVAIQSVLCCPDLGVCSIYPEHALYFSRNFSRGPQSQTLCKIRTVACSELSRAGRDSISENRISPQKNENISLLTLWAPRNFSKQVERMF